MRSTPIAWYNVTHNKARAAAALCGVVFAMLLIYMQLGFYDSCLRSSTMIYDQLRFDIALLSPQYVHLRISGAFPKARLYQVKHLAEVSSVAPLYVSNSTYRVPETRARREITVLAIDPANPPFQLPEVAASAHRLAKLGTAIMDNQTGRGYGDIREGLIAELENRQIEIVAAYAHGTGFLCDASIIISDRTLASVVPGSPLDRVSMGLVTLVPGANTQDVLEKLRELLPTDVKVVKRRDLEAQEQRFFVRTKPVGLMFSAGTLLAFVVGAVTLYQILNAEIRNRLRECATLLALGYTGRHMQWVVVQQALLFTMFGFVPATLMAIGLYNITQISTRLPMEMTWLRVASVLVLSVIMCSLSGLLVSLKVRRADPADLF